MLVHVVPDVKRRTPEPIIRDNIEPRSTVHTDELQSCLWLEGAGSRMRASTTVRANYVRDSCQVNSVEGFWSRLKNSTRGTHVHVSGKHLQRYVKEFESRYNRRQRPETMFADLVSSF